MTRAILLASACVVTLLGAGGCRRDDPTAQQIRVTLSSANGTSTAGPRWKLLQQVYRDRDYRPLWLDGAKLEGRARDLIETLCHAEREGLRAADYDLAGLGTDLTRLRDAKNASPAALAALDLRLTKDFLDYGADLLAGRLDPRAVDDGWYIRARRAMIDSTLRSTLSHKDFDDLIAPLRPRQQRVQGAPSRPGRLPRAAGQGRVGHDRRGLPTQAGRYGSVGRRPPLPAARDRRAGEGRGKAGV